MTLNPKSRAVLRGAALYDIAASGLLAIPPVVPVALNLVAALDAALGFGTIFAPVDATTVFLISLAAITILAWGAIRLIEPSAAALKVDIAYRLALVAAQVWAVALGATPILLGISAVLIAICLLELRALRGGALLLAPAAS